MFWNVRPTPTAAISAGRFSDQVVLLELDRAAVGPVDTRDQVEDGGLPAPLGPMSPKIEPRGTAKLTRVTALIPAEASW